MDPTHWIVVGVIGCTLLVSLIGFLAMARILRKDEALDAATFLALRELRERFEQSRRQG